MLIIRGEHKGRTGTLVAFVNGEISVRLPEGVARVPLTCARLTFAEMRAIHRVPGWGDIWQEWGLGTDGTFRPALQGMQGTRPGVVWMDEVSGK